jgi:hypothetical protein
MTIRSFWTILLKVLGIWIVFGSLTVIPMFLSTFYFVHFSESTQSIVAMIVFLLLFAAVYFLIIRVFIFKTSWLIDKFHLDKGFDNERLDFNIKHSSIIRLAVIIIGGLLFIENLPPLIQNIFVFFQQKYMFRESPLVESVIFYFVKTLLGYVLMTNSRKIVSFILKHASKDNDMKREDDL